MDDELGRSLANIIQIMQDEGFSLEEAQADVRQRLHKTVAMAKRSRRFRARLIKRLTSYEYTRHDAEVLRAFIAEFETTWWPPDREALKANVLASLHSLEKVGNEQLALIATLGRRKAKDMARKYREKGPLYLK